MLDLDTILEWVRTNPMGTEFMLLEIIKGFDVKAEINMGLIFIQTQDPQDDRYISVLVTNRNGDDIVSHKDIKINKEARLNFVCLNYKGAIAYSLLTKDSLPDVLSVPEVWNLQDGDYLVYSDSVMVSRMSGEIEPTNKEKKKNVKNKTSV